MSRIAYEYYTRAMTRVQYIGYILVGEIPEGENITIHEETIENGLLNTLLRDNEDTANEDMPEADAAESIPLS